MVSNTLIWCLVSYGLMNIVVFGVIFKPVRDFFTYWGSNPFKPFNKLGGFIGEMITCPMCFSVWSGFFLSIILYSPTHQLFGTTEYISWFFDGILSSGVVWIINSIVEFFEENRLK